jgi:serine/threonine protein kinase
VNAPTDPILSTAPQQMGPHTPREWLDALSKGTCDPDTFSRAMTDYFQSAPDGSWEVVSLLDQYYRRGKIDGELFQRLKSRFQSVALGADTVGASRVPPPLAQIKAPRINVPVAAVPEGASHPAADIPKPGGDRRNPSTDAVLRGRYRLGKALERDGVGTVYEAIDQDRLDLAERSRKMAIKVLSKAVSGRVDLYGELRREFQYLQSLSHPNILRVHEIDRDGDTVFFSMELLSGLPLSAVLSKRNHLALERSHAATIIRCVGDAILYAHMHGVVHGDIGPRNIFITDEGEIRILGFGASRSAAPELPAAEFESDQRLSIATSDYAGDQVLVGHHPEVGDDLYGIACLACLLFTGYHPFNNLSAAKARTSRLKPRRPPGLTYHQWNALRPGLKFNRQRPPSDIAKLLQQVVQYHSAEQLPILSALLTPPRPRRRWSAVRALIVLIALGAAVGVWSNFHFESVAGIVETLDTQVRRIATIADSWVARLSDAFAPSPGGASAKPDAGQSAVSPPTPSGEPAAKSATATAAPPAPAAPASVAQMQARTAARSAPPAPASNSPPRIELALETTEVSSNAPAALVLVRRKGNLLRDATFTWWTETGTAKAGVDFEPVAPRMETIKAGKDRVNLQISIVSDSTRRKTKNFFVVIAEPGPYVSLGERTVEKVSILPP